MAVDFGKIEARITVPTATWTGTLVESTNAESNTFTIAAGDYFHSSGDTGADLAATLQSALDAASDTGVNNFNYTVTPSFGEGGTGKTTITFSGTGTFSITWTSTDLRDVMGWTSNPAAVTTTTSENHARNIWLPDVVKQTPWGDGNDGHYETDANATESNSGHANVLYGRKKQVLSFVTWPDVAASKTFVNDESAVNESFEKFWIDGILGEATWSSNPGGPLRYHYDADVDATYTEYYCTGDLLKSFQPVQVRSGWTGRYKVTIDRLVKVPA